jgi:hypothetical protein
MITLWEREGRNDWRSGSTGRIETLKALGTQGMYIWRPEELVGTYRRCRADLRVYSFIRNPFDLLVC